MSTDVDLAKEWAQFYRERGYNPLPSRTDAKRPMVRFAEYWDQPAPSDLFERHETTNIQVMTGRHWGLLAIDLDGLEAREWWYSQAGPLPDTWITHSGGDGLHLWFTIRMTTRRFPKAFLWRGTGEHQAVERLCDRSLIMAPPSIHPKTGQRYRFLDASHSPARVPMPALCPRWILDAPAIGNPKKTKVARIDRPIGNVAALVKSWGVRLAGNPSPTGWIPCHAIDREDSHPSAAIHSESGFYVDHGSGQRMGIVDLSIRLGIYRDVREALQHLKGD